MQRRLLFVSVLTTTLGVTSCQMEAVGPPVLESEGLEVRAEVEPSTIPSGDSAAVRVVFENTTGAARRIEMAMGCPFFLQVFDRSSGDVVEMEGTGYACLGVVSAFEIPASDSVVWSRPIVAEVDGSAMEPGLYEARLDFTTGTPPLEIAFSVE